MEMFLDQVMELKELEKKTTQGEWIIRELSDTSTEFFIERPAVGDEAFGVDVMGDEDYPTKRADAEFIIPCKKFLSEVD